VNQTRLAAAGAGQHQGCAQRRAHRLALRVVEAIEKMRYVHRARIVLQPEPGTCPDRFLDASQAHFLRKLDQGQDQREHDGTGDDAMAPKAGMPPIDADEHRQGRDLGRPESIWAARHCRWP